MVNNLKIEPIPSGAPQRNEESIRAFQRKIYRKAKQDKGYRFYSLYDKITSERILREAYHKVKENDGSPGIDNITFEEIEQKGIDEFIKGIEEELKRGTYKPEPVKRVYIEKANGKLRPLGIPTIKDRVVQMSCKIVIEPIFEARFEENSYGFRPKRKAADAICKIREKVLSEGKKIVYDADITKYFDNIRHDKLQTLLMREITDKKVLNLLKMWLKTPISEDGKLTKSVCGTPQGGVISPLMANIYLNELIKEVNRKGSIFQKNGIDIITYADDFVLIGTSISPTVIKELKRLLGIMGLELNEEKSKLVNLFEGRIKFLGFEMGWEKIKHKKVKRYLRISPSGDSVKKLRGNLREVIDGRRASTGVFLAEEINKKLRGWINYFRIGTITNVQKAKESINWYINKKLYYLHKKKKSQKRSHLINQGIMMVYIERYGMISPLAM